MTVLRDCIKLCKAVPIPENTKNNSHLSLPVGRRKTTGHHTKNVQEVSKHSFSQDQAESKEKCGNPGMLSKTHVGYWKARLFKNCYTRDGSRHVVNEWSVKIQHLGKRKSFALGSTNRDLSADKAKELYLTILSKGWDAAEVLFNPTMTVRKDDPSLGDLFVEIERKAGLEPKTFRNYVSSFRTIASEIHRLGDEKSKYDYRSGGRQRWIEKVDSIKLAAITPERVQEWKVAHIKSAGSSPVAVASAKRTVNSYIRCARSLFSSKVLRFIKIRLPQPLPFDGVELERAGSTRYQSKINPQLLVNLARAELREKQPECYKVFLLALFCGLRRAEIDLLQWSAVDWENQRVWVKTTEHFKAKTEDSEDFVEVDPEVLEEVRVWMQGSRTPFVINSPLPPRAGMDRQYYRCHAVFRNLTSWLRDKGISANKPLHELRKEFGSLVNLKYGIYAASRALRHSDISTSVRHYVAKKERVTVGLGHLLTTAEPISLVDDGLAPGETSKVRRELP